MTYLILDMPRKWQVYDRLRGVELSKERFQFIFKYEHDLEEVLKKRVWTFNEWSIVIDRWVIEIAFDPEKPQSKDYVRVKVNFDVSRPVRRSKDKCPLLIQMLKDKANARRQSILNAKCNTEPVLKESDPLLGIITKEQVGPDPYSGRLRISPEVMQDMRLYLLPAQGPECKAREERVKQSILDLKDD
ncbi:uncharacterized protein LOC112087256 [Eutrema salsugineum]|uniref:uncharacterized protein LOC112087256 n=1 Tax=Eutrema salsugineum TaxID=72664 RepID=UPI000CED093B|nr:uncharacterized protein LOC112087256 [Eutrema salsugineum]